MLENFFSVRESVPVCVAVSKVRSTQEFETIRESVAILVFFPVGDAIIVGIG